MAYRFDKHALINGITYNKGYYLIDVIEWVTFVKSIPKPLGKKLFTKHQEATRKDVKRAFRVLQS